ncbi:MAG: hypothetical protein R2705_01215 [Ilumatobacteraceae bacterium]
MLYLEEYRYASSDAYASRILAILALDDVLSSFEIPGGPTAEKLRATVERDLTDLAGLQGDDGGFGFWRRSMPSDPYNSVQAFHALVLARQSGHTVPDDVYFRAQDYVASIESRYPTEMPQEIRDSITAYALLVRHLAGDDDPARAARLWNERRDTLQADAIARIWQVIDDPSIDTDIERWFTNRVAETASSVTFTTDYGDGAWMILHSDRRTDAIVLDALMSDRPQSDLVVKVVQGLLGGRTKGRWDNVQENSFILLASAATSRRRGQTPDFVARVWLGDRYAGEHTFSGRETDRVEFDLPMTDVVAAGQTAITLSKSGTGRLYYRLGLRYAPDDLTLDPLDRGFEVQRQYEAVDDPADVTRDADGTWHVKAGARVAVRLTMVAESDRAHAALIDPLPAGLEPLNPALAVTEDIPADESDTSPGDGDVIPLRGWWWGPWYSYENLRDDRAEAIADYLPAGVYEYRYVARATTPGSFVVPPTRAEQIYAPETFGRSASDLLVVDA